MPNHNIGSFMISRKELILITLAIRIETIQKMHTDEGLKARNDTTCLCRVAYSRNMNAFIRNCSKKKQWQQHVPITQSECGGNMRKL